jgi:hypothetical protein
MRLFADLFLWRQVRNLTAQTFFTQKLSGMKLQLRLFHADSSECLAVAQFEFSFAYLCEKLCVLCGFCITLPTGRQVNRKERRENTSQRAQR